MITLVTGGSGSGKSEYAEGLILDSSCSRRFYVATMIAYGKEGRDKVERHRMLRQGKGFITIEKPRDVGRVMFEEHEAGSGASSRADRALLLECVSNLAANEMFKDEETGEAEAGEQQGSPIQCLSHKIAGDIISLAGQVRDMVIVTNEVCSECTRDSADMIRYKKILSEVHLPRTWWWSWFTAFPCSGSPSQDRQRLGLT